MNILEQAYTSLYPDKAMPKTYVKYSGQFSDFNANLRLISSHLELRLSKKWKTVNPEITLGLVQSLILSMFKDKKSTLNIDLYNNFLKSLHLSIPKDNIDPLLAESFNRVSNSYFNDSIEIPNLVWGTSSLRKLGSYNYKTDTISISSIFKQAELQLVDYIMYHELLHKKYKFTSKNGRNYFHDSKFKKAEKAFPNSGQMENRIKQLIAKSRKTGRTKKKSVFSAFFPW